VVRCEDLVDIIRTERSLREISKQRDAYDLSFRLVRKYEYMLRRGYDPSKNRDAFIRGIISEIALKFSSKRLSFSLSKENAEKISNRILDVLMEMSEDFRSLCGLYFQLRKIKDMEHMIELVKG